MLPDAKHHNPDPDHIRTLIDKAGLSQRAVARLLGVDDRTVRYWCSGQREIPYSAQFCLEALAARKVV